VLVTGIYGLIGPRPGGPGNRAGTDSAPAGAAVSDTVLLDRRADTLALALSAFDMRARMFDTRRVERTDGNHAFAAEGARHPDPFRGRAPSGSPGSS